MTLDSIVIIAIFAFGWGLGYKFGFKKGNHCFNNNNCWDVLIKDINPKKWFKSKK